MKSEIPQWRRQRYSAAQEHWAPRSSLCSWPPTLFQPSRQSQRDSQKLGRAGSRSSKNATSWKETAWFSPSPKPSNIFNAVGTTRAAAGGIQISRKSTMLCASRTLKQQRRQEWRLTCSSSVGGQEVFSLLTCPTRRWKLAWRISSRRSVFDHAVILKSGMILGSETFKASLFHKYFVSLKKLRHGV